MHKQTKLDNDILTGILLLEDGQMTEEEAIEFFQDLIDSGIVWRLQGGYGRTASDLIKAGLCTMNTGAMQHGN